MLRSSIFPSKWPIVSLIDVVDFLDHLRKPVKASERIEGAYPYYGANGLQGSINDYIFDEPLVLLAEDGGHFGSKDRDIAYIAEGKYWVNNHAHVLKPKPNVDLRFLFRVLQRYDVTSYIKGATRAKLTKGDASRMLFPLPPLEEQKRIAAILDKADAIRRKRQQAIQLADDFLRSVFLEMFGDPVTNPKGWEMKQLSTFADIENGDRSKNYPSGADIQDEGVLFLSTKNIKNQTIDLSNLQFISQEKFDSLSRGKLKQNDLVITLRGTLGSCAKFCGDFETGFINAQLMIIRSKPTIEPDFLHALLTSKSIQAHFQDIGCGAAVPQLTAKQIKELDLYLPPIEKQREFLKVANAIKKMVSKQKKANSIYFFNSLSQKAFSGQL